MNECMVNKGNSFSSSSSPRSHGEMDVILSISFKVTAEIEIRKHKVMSAL